MSEPSKSPDILQVRNAKPGLRLTTAIMFVILGVIALGGKDANSPAIGVVFILISPYFLWRYWVERKIVNAAPAEMLAQVKDEEARAVMAKAAVARSSVVVKYKAGLEDLGLFGKYSLFASGSGLVFEQTGRRTEIPWADIESVDAGTEDELRSRLTLTRVALIGVWALAAKKEKKQNFYVTITCKNSIGLFDLVSSGNNQKVLSLAKAFSVTCNSRIRAANAK